MTRAPEALSAPVRAMLDQERLLPMVSPAVRARVLAHARAALQAPANSILRDERAFVGVRPTAHTRWAAAAALVGVTALAAGAGAYALRAHLVPPTERPAASPAAPPVAPARPKVRAAAPVALTAPSPEAAVPPGAGIAPPRPRADAIRAELRLLRRARAAVIREDFSAALSPITEHARRFPDGRLAEEREALRVKTLAGLGRTAEAERAAGVFTTRFPRSVLSPAVSKMPSSRP